jgi:hypothetical protein
MTTAMAPITTILQGMENANPALAASNTLLIPQLHAFGDLIPPAMRHPDFPFSRMSQIRFYDSIEKSSPPNANVEGLLKTFRSEILNVLPFIPWQQFDVMVADFHAGHHGPSRAVVHLCLAVGAAYTGHAERDQHFIAGLDSMPDVGIERIYVQVLVTIFYGLLGCTFESYQWLGFTADTIRQATSTDAVIHTLWACNLLQRLVPVSLA